VGWTIDVEGLDAPEAEDATAEEQTSQEESPQGQTTEERR
jgi:hypothetical protein